MTQPKSNLDKFFYLMGDEDTNVGLMCRFCDHGGRPTVFYTTDSNDTTWKGTDVAIVDSISELIDVGSLHILEHIK